MNDSVTGETFSKTKNKQKILTKFYLGEQPYGIWTHYDKKGNVESTKDYNFVVCYGECIPDGAIKSKDMEGAGGKLDPNTEKIQQHIMNNFRYPELAHKQGVQGKVMVQFTTDETRKVDNFRIVNGVHITLDTECIRILNSLKKLEPYEKDGRRVMVYYTMPIGFKSA